MTKTALTHEQEAIAQHQTGHAIVSAVAGSGKSTTLIERTVRLLRHGADPDRILILMFNTDAQRHFSQRLRKRIGATPVRVQTFHSVGNGLAKRLQQMGRPVGAVHAKDNRKWAREALREAWKRQTQSDHMPPMVAEEFQRFLTLYKSCIVGPAEVFKRYQFPREFQCFITAAGLYENLRMANRGLTFDDMIWDPVQEFLRVPALQSIAANKMDFIMVDEAQDLSEVQANLLKILAGTRASVMIVGDVDQSLYSWRGARPDQMLEHLPNHFAPATRYPLTTTFRFGHETALMASHLITRNVERDDKIVVAAPGNPDTRVSYLVPKDADDSGLVDSLRDLATTGGLHRACMLVRNYSHSVFAEYELLEAGIPFHVYGRESLLHLEEVAVQVAALAIAADHWPVDEDRVPIFLGALARFPSMYLKGQLIPPLIDDLVAQWEVDPTRLDVPFRRLAAQLQQQDPKVAAKLEARADMIALLSEGGLRDSSPEVILGVFDSMILFTDALDRMAEHSEYGAERRANANAFRTLAARHPNLQDFLDVLGPLAATKEQDPPDGDHLCITSCHRAKGLEWERVYVAGLTRGIFPSDRSPIEEERRLAYVAYTRATHELILIRPGCKRLDAHDEQVDQLPDATIKQVASDFLFEAEIGASRKLAELIRGERGGKLRMRDDALAARYLREAGIDGIVLASSGHARPVGLKPIHQGMTLRPGQRVWHPTQGFAHIERPISGPAYVIRMEQGDRLTNDVIAGREWCLAS